MLRRIFPFIRPHARMFAAAVFLMFVTTIMELAIPYVTKTAIDRYIVPVQGAKGDINGLQTAALILLLIILIDLAANFGQVMVMEYTGQKVMHALRMRLFAHIQSLSVRFFTKQPVGRLVTRVTNDITNLHELLTSVLIFVLKDFFLVTGITVVLFSIDAQLALMVYLVFPLVFISAYHFAKNARAAYRTLRIKVAEINTKFSETIGGIDVIHAFNRQEDNARLFKRVNHENFLAGMQQITVFALFMPFIELMSSVGLAAVIYFGGVRFIATHITLGELVIFISYIRMFFRPIRDIAEKYNITLNAVSSAERIFLLLDESDGIDERRIGPSSETPDRIKSLEFDAVRFSYVPGEPVLKGISFCIRAGETNAIIGQTGAGKTSIINLIIRFHDPDSGKIRINGIDISKFSTSKLREKIAVVNQDPFLFTGTLRENIFSKSRPAGYDNENEILSLAGCIDLIRRLPDGLDTKISGQGSGLSSGERQLISIARAMAKNPQLIIFDEATSYIDSETEKAINLAMANLTKGRTAIIIAHRLSTIRSANNILVLSSGRIVESGTHEELMNRRGVYFRMIRVQDYRHQF
ncbi:MAG: ABC transporter ATP-binding protein [Deltaproteobacteria bacterium]|nr:ABC transporter ATP-binding protein [Deltaproteobacteria bacterium]